MKRKSVTYREEKVLAICNNITVFTLTKRNENKNVKKEKLKKKKLVIENKNSLNY